eukprot:UN03243
MEKIKVLVTDTECNSYSNKIGVNNRSRRGSKEMKTKTKLTRCLINKQSISIMCWGRLKVTIINVESKMRKTPNILIKCLLLKRNKEKRSASIMGQLGQNEIDFTNNHDFMTENP